jgi:hypothetical protein
VSEKNFSANPERLAVLAFVGTSVQGRLSGAETPHSALPVKVALVIVALEPSAATWPVSATVQGTGVHTRSFTAVEIEPVAVNAVPV